MYLARLFLALFVISAIGQDPCQDGDEFCSKVKSCAGQPCETATTTKTTTVTVTETKPPPHGDGGDPSDPPVASSPPTRGDEPTSIPDSSERPPTADHPPTSEHPPARPTDNSPGLSPSPEHPTSDPSPPASEIPTAPIPSPNGQQPLLPSPRTSYYSDPNGPHRCASTTIPGTSSAPDASSTDSCSEQQRAAIEEANRERDRARRLQKNAENTQAKADAQKAQLSREREELDRQRAELQRQRTQNERDAEKNRDDAVTNDANRKENARRAAELDEQARNLRAEQDKLRAEQRQQDEEARKARALAAEAETERQALKADRQKLENDQKALDADREELARQRRAFETEKDEAKRQNQRDEDEAKRKLQDDRDELERQQKQNQKDREQMKADQKRLDQDKADWEKEKEKQRKEENEKKKVDPVVPYCGTPLHAAAKRHDYTQVQQLLKQGASISTKDFRGNTPLHCAYDIQQQPYSIDALNQTSLILLENGADYMTKNNNYSTTPLQLAWWNALETPLRQLCKALPVQYDIKTDNTARRVALVQGYKTPVPLEMLITTAIMFDSDNGGAHWTEGELRPFDHMITSNFLMNRAGDINTVDDRRNQPTWWSLGLERMSSKAVQSIDFFIDSRQISRSQGVSSTSSKRSINDWSNSEVCYHARVWRKATDRMEDGPSLFCELGDSERSLKHRALLQLGTQDDPRLQGKPHYMTPDQIDAWVGSIASADYLYLYATPVRNNGLESFHTSIFVRYKV